MSILIISEIQTPSSTYSKRKRPNAVPTNLSTQGAILSLMPLFCTIKPVVRFSQCPIWPFAFTYTPIRDLY